MKSGSLLPVISIAQQAKMQPVPMPRQMEIQSNGRANKFAIQSTVTTLHT